MNTDEAHAHLAEAADLANRLGECNGMRQHFGPTNVTIWRLGIGVELDTADRLAPQRTRMDPITRDLVLTLDRRAPRRVWELDSLRNRFGIGGQGSRGVHN